MQIAVVFDADENFLVGLAVTEFRKAFKFFFLGFLRDPVELAHFTRFGIKGRFVAVGNVEYVVL